MAVFLPPPRKRFQPDFSLATVNIVLLLLLYFIVAGDPAEQGERAITPPTTRDLALAGLPRPLLALPPDGELTLDGTATTPTALYTRIAAGELPRVHLLAARDHPAQALLALAGTLASSGAEVQMVTLRPAERAQRGGERP